jgi:flagellar biosynthesis/type III secretory pathway chaperone
MSPASDVQTSFPNGHPSAMPAPLRFSQQSRATAAAENEDPKSPLPANQTLDAYLVLHNHIDRSQWATQEAVVRETKDVNKEVVKAHHENLKHLSTLFGDVMEKVKSIENESVRTAEGVERYKLEVIDAVNAMGAAMQNNLVKPMDKLFESNTTLAMKVDKLSTRIEELEKQSKANTDVLASFQPPQESMLNMSSSSRPGTMYSTASHDAVNSYDTVTGAVSPPYAGVPSGGPPGLPNPSSTYYNPYGAAHPSQWSGGYMLPQSTIKDLGREQRHMYFSSFGDTHMQATSGNMPTHPAFRNGNGHGQSQ